jgi:DNA-directed RNA polymerase sigma subunit (sigma70/sigma32)
MLPFLLVLSATSDSDGELADLVADRSATSPVDAAATALLPAEIAKLMASLTPREREILTLRFGLKGGEPPLKKSASTFTSTASESDKSKTGP